MAYPCSENLPGCRVLDHDGTDQQVRLDGFRRWLDHDPSARGLPVTVSEMAADSGVSPPFQKQGVPKFRAWQDDLIRARDTSSSQDRLSRSLMSS